MSDNRLYLGGITYQLSGGGAVAGATTITVSNFVDADGNAITMAGSFGSKGYGTIQPGTSSYQEFITFTGVTNNGDGTWTLTGVKTQLAQSPYTETSGLALSHPGASNFIISNTPGFYDGFTNKNDDETVIGEWTFPNGANRPGLDSDTDTAVLTDFVDFGQLGRTSFSGTVNASTVQKGIAQEATLAENYAHTGTGSTGARLFQNPSTSNGQRWFDPAASATGTDSYAITVVPSITSYTNGDVFTFQADVANNSTASLNVNGIGAHNIFKNSGNGLQSLDIGAGQFVTVVYDGSTNTFSMMSQLGAVSLSTDGKEIYDADVGGDDAYAISPILSLDLTDYSAGMNFRFKPTTANTGAATLTVNAFAAKNIVRVDGSALKTGDIIAGQVADVTYNGTAFQLNNPGALSAGNSSVADTLHEHSLVGSGANPGGILETKSGGYTFNGSANDGLTATPGAGGAVTRSFVTTIITAATANSSLVSAGFSADTSVDFDNVWIFESVGKLSSTTAQDGMAGVGSGTTPANHILTDRHFQFIFEDGKVYASNADGTTQTATDVSSGITLTNFNTYRIEYRLTAGHVLFYINDTLVADHSTNLPTANGTSEKLNWAMTADSGSKSLTIFNDYFLYTPKP